MSPETTSAPTAPPKKSKRQANAEVTAEALAALCAIKSDERIDAQRAYKKAETAFYDKARALDKEHAELAKANDQAASDVKAHEAFLMLVEKGQLSRKAYDAEHSDLERAAKTAQEALEKNRERVQTDMAPLRKKVQDCDARVQDLARQWIFFEKRAKAAGIDTSTYWTPDDELPPEDEPAPTEAPAPGA